MRGRQVPADVVNCVKQMSNFVHITLTSSCWEPERTCAIGCSVAARLLPPQQPVMHPQGLDDASPWWHRLLRVTGPILPGILFSYSNAPAGWWHHYC